MNSFDIVILDQKTLGDDIRLDPIAELGSLRVYPGTSREEVVDHIGNASVVLINKVRLDREVLSRCPCVRLIGTFATGYDAVDIGYCREKGITVCNVVGYSTESVVNVTVGMALNLSCRLGEYREHVVSGLYTKEGCANYLKPVFHDLEGKVWGVCGYGHIGKRVAEVARALGCRVLYTKEHPDLLDPDCVSLDELCRNADILSLHMPLTDKTRKLFDASRISGLRTGAIFINVGRGGLCDEAALADAVEQGRLGGLGVDVYTSEPFPESHPFYRIRNYPNVLLTPHMAWASVEARDRCIREVAENIKAFQNGTPRNVVS